MTSNTYTQTSLCKQTGAQLGVGGEEMAESGAATPGNRAQGVTKLIF
jgi:hypothetical protein